MGALVRSPGPSRVLGGGEGTPPPRLYLTSNAALIFVWEGGVKGPQTPYSADSEPCGKFLT